MDEETKKNLESIRKLTAAQTLIQAGAVVELEAHRRELAAQTHSMESSRRAALHESTRALLEKYDLANFLNGIAEVEVAAKTNDPGTELLAILANKEGFRNAPANAGLPERIRAKELLFRIEPLIKQVQSSGKGPLLSKTGGRTTK